MQITTIILALSLVIIMFGMGLSLTANDFKRVFIEPKAILIGLVNQLVLLPAIGFLLISIFDVRAEVAIGLIILAACPGGPTSNLITHLAKGDTALSVSLTAVSSFVTLLTIPIIINLGLRTVLGSSTEIQLDFLQTIAQVFIIVVFPITIGMIIKAKKEAFAMRMEKPVRTASAIVFVLVLVGVVVSQKENIIPYAKEAGFISLLLNVMTMGMGMIIASIMKLSRKQAISISIESGIQNGTLAIAIATGLLMNTEYAIAPAIYSLIMFITGGLVIFWGSKKVSS
jgi:bile acid:Na+ symporter, BASS family